MKPPAAILDSAPELWHLQLTLANADENEGSGVGDRSSVGLELDGYRRHNDEGSNRRDQTCQSISESLFEALPYPHEGDVGADRARIEKDRVSNTSSVDCDRDLSARRFRRLEKIDWNAVVPREVIERSRGKNGELALRSSNRSRAGTNRAITSCNENACRTGLDRIANAVVKLFGVDLADVERARLLESSAGSFKVS